MEMRNENGRIAPRLYVAGDGDRFIALDAKGKTFFNEDMTLYLAVRKDVGSLEVLALVDALALACDQIVCVVNSAHPSFEMFKSAPFTAQ